jgi:hypothetical protein
VVGTVPAQPEIKGGHSAFRTCPFWVVLWGVGKTPVLTAPLSWPSNSRHRMVALESRSAEGAGDRLRRAAR